MIGKLLEEGVYSLGWGLIFLCSESFEELEEIIGDGLSDG